MRIVYRLNVFLVWDNIQNKHIDLLHANNMCIHKMKKIARQTQTSIVLVQVLRSLSYALRYYRFVGKKLYPSDNKHDLLKLGKDVRRFIF